LRRRDDDAGRTRTKRDAEWTRRLREKAWDERAADGSDAEQERRDYPLPPTHAFLVPVWFGIRLPVLLPQARDVR
jgi:hypothetical protein